MNKNEALLHALLRAVEDAYQEHECGHKETPRCGLCLLRRNLKWRKDEVEEHDRQGRYEK